MALSKDGTSLGLTFPIREMDEKTVVTSLAAVQIKSDDKPNVLRAVPAAAQLALHSVIGMAVIICTYSLEALYKLLRVSKPHV